MRLKTLGLLVLSMTALMAFAASAYATTVTSPTGTVATGEEEESTSEGHVAFHNPIAKIECNARLTGRIEGHGSGVTATGPVTSFTFTNCTNSWHVTVVSNGSLIAHYKSGYNATITSNGATVEATRFGVSCRYITSNTSLGTATGGNPTTMHIEAAIPFHSGSGLCGAGSIAYTGSFIGKSSAYFDA